MTMGKRSENSSISPTFHLKNHLTSLSSLTIICERRIQSWQSKRQASTTHKLHSLKSSIRWTTQRKSHQLQSRTLWQNMMAALSIPQDLAQETIPEIGVFEAVKRFHERESNQMVRSAVLPLFNVFLSKAIEMWRRLRKSSLSKNQSEKESSLGQFLGQPLLQAFIVLSKSRRITQL